MINIKKIFLSFDIFISFSFSKRKHNLWRRFIFFFNISKFIVKNNLFRLLCLIFCHIIQALEKIIIKISKCSNI